MTATLQQTQSDLVKLIELARGGEDVVITEQGEAIARLTAIPTAKTIPDRRRWVANLARLRDLTTGGKSGATSDQIIEELRSERFE